MTLVSTHPYAKFLPRVAKPNRYTGAEHGAIVKDWTAGFARVCLAFPDIYDIGMSHLGFRILYKLLNDHERILAERCYTPWVDMQAELVRNGKLLSSLESVRPLCDFDVIGFSLQYELTYTNILGMLDMGGVPLRSANRGDDDPLVIAGGPVATHMEPMAPFLDAVLIGDGEAATQEIVLTWVDAKKKGAPREERLRLLSAIEGVYVPSLYDTAVDPDTGLEVVTGPKETGLPYPIVRRLVADINDYPFPSESPVGGPEAIFDRMSIEVARGCTEGCRFCQAGMIYRPVRERDPQTVVDTVLEALEKTGQDEVSLTALSTADVSCISPLIKTLVEKTAPQRVSLSVASLRAYGLEEGLLDDMRKVRAAGLTFAPEAGTQRMRDVINKNVTEQQLLETAERVFSRGFDKMKLYFIIGLPTETDEDVLGIVEVGNNALSVGKRLGKRPRVTVSVSTHVPKPHTPFQWCAMDPPSRVYAKQALLREAARSARGLALKMHECETSVLEGIFARGDRGLARVIERAYQRGARFDSWEDQQHLELWQEAFDHFDIDTSRYLGTLPIHARLPWDHIDVGLEDGFLEREYRKAVQSRLSPPCGKAKGMFVHHTNVAAARDDKRRLVCYDCGVACDMTKMREQRVNFLSQMGAVAPAVARATEPPRGAQPERFRPAPKSGEVKRVRLRYAKTGASALLGHLDLIRELGRVIRRAGVDVAYTKGFHPKPDMSFGPALSLGVLSIDEYVDVKLIAPPEPAHLVASLNGAAAGGLRFFDAALLGPVDPALGRIVTGARYVLGFAAGSLPEDEGFLAGRVEEFLKRESVRVRRTVKGIGKPVDVRALVTKLRVCPLDEPVLAELGVLGSLRAIEVELAISTRGSARLGEVVEAVFGAEALAPPICVRVALLAGQHGPMDLAMHRRPMANASPVEPTSLTLPELPG